jgi:pyruvate,water dikinase
MSSEKRIFWFEELGQEHNDVVGKKCANLGEMMRMGLAVPPGFALSIDMYREFMRQTALDEEMARYVDRLGELKGKGIAVFDEVSETLRKMIESREMPEALEKEILSHYEDLCDRLKMPDVPVSVRSAGTESRPGMFETFLNVKGKEDLLDKVKKVWASAYTTRAVAFRANKDIPILGDELGIAIPKMVNARAAGIGFTVNPVDGDDTKIIIEANWGLGEGVVSGAETVDGFVVDKASLKILARNIGIKTRYVVNKEKGAEWDDVPLEKQRLPCLSDEEVREVAKLAKSLEEKLGSAQDMEWAIDDDIPFPENLFHLQTRPAKVQTKKPVSTTDKIIDLIAKRYQKP